MSTSTWRNGPKIGPERKGKPGWRKEVSSGLGTLHRNFHHLPLRKLAGSFITQFQYFYAWGAETNGLRFSSLTIYVAEPPYVEGWKGLATLRMRSPTKLKFIKVLKALELPLILGVYYDHRPRVWSCMFLDPLDLFLGQGRLPEPPEYTLALDSTVYEPHLNTLQHDASLPFWNTYFKLLVNEVHQVLSKLNDQGIW